MAMILQESSDKSKHIKIFVSSLGLRICAFSGFGHIQHRGKELYVYIGYCNQNVLL